MSYVDDVITINATRVIANWPGRNYAYGNALRIQNAIAAFEAVCHVESDLIIAYGLDWDRAVKDHSNFRGFHGDRPFTPHSAARVAAAEALHTGEGDAPVALPRAA
jgi:hypothetical protein